MKKLNPSEYYDFLFPEIGKTTRKDWHYVFSEYGCMEAINVEYDVSNFNKNVLALKYNYRL